MTVVFGFGAHSDIGNGPGLLRHGRWIGGSVERWAAEITPAVREAVA